MYNPDFIREVADEIGDHDPNENPDDAFREVVGKAWLRGVLASENQITPSHTLKRKSEIQSDWSVNERPYPFTKPSETEPGFKEIVSAENPYKVASIDKTYEDVVEDLIDNHPDLIYAYSVWYDGWVSDRFKKTLLAKSDFDSFDEALKEFNPT